MRRVLVTGATGLIGANVCRLLAEAGVSVAALVRPGSDSEPLAHLGCELAEGDVRDAESVVRAAEGADAIVHAAALLGGRTQDANASEDTNYLGSVHCYDAGRSIRVVEMATTTFFRHETTLTEDSPLLDEDQVPDDPYSITKFKAYREAKRRVAEGQDIVVVIPGGTFGPSPVPKRSMGSTSYNRALRAAIVGRLTAYLDYPVPWVRAQDVAAATVAALTAGQPGDTFLAFGLEAPKATTDLLNMACEALPELLDGEALVCLGYSEPDSGSDVAAARTRAVRLQDGNWRIDGQKMWTSYAHMGQYVILLTRTNPDVPKHRGLTFFLVPLDTPGVSVTPVPVMGDDRTNTTFYDNVIVSDDMRIGEVTGGWAVMGVGLAFERGVVGGALESTVLWREMVEWAAEGEPGQRPLDDPRWRATFARARIDTQVSWLLNQRSAWIAASGGMPSIEGSAAKLFATQALQRHVAAYLDMAGPEGLLKEGQPGAVAGGALERAVRHAPVTTIYGGTTEIQRNNIAERHLGLPRVR